MLEIWKDIPEFEGRYQASTEGRVRSLDLVMQLISGPYTHKGRILKPRSGTTNAYLMVSLSREGKRSYKLVHRLIASTFIENKEAKAEVNHKDGNILNNRLENLEWVTSSENSIHAIKHGRLRPPRKPNTSGYVGVSYHRATNKWMASLGFEGKRFYLGVYETKEEAYQSRCKKQKELLHANRS